MKASIRRIIIISIFMLLAFCVKSFAASSFEFKFQEGVKVQLDQTFEIPVIIDNIDIEGVEKKLTYFSGTVNYNDTVFEFLECEDLYDQGIVVNYNSETQKISTTIDVSNWNGTNTDNLIMVGKMKFKVKPNSTPGKYDFCISDIEASNGENSVQATYKVVEVEVKGNEEPAVAPYVDDSTDKANKLVESDDGTSKKAILKIEVSQDGKKITITPDEENGSKISSITYKNTKLKKEEGKFVLATDPNMAYELFIYGADGKFLGNQYVTTVVQKENNNDAKETDKTKADGSKADGSKEDGSKEINNDNVKKSPQTGDYIIIAVGTLIIMLSIIVLTRTTVKNKKNA